MLPEPQTITLRQITGKYCDVELSDIALNHFNNPYNYTKEILQEWASLPFTGIVTSQDKTILDIGANVGLFALHVAPYAKNLICVEPTPEHFNILKQLTKATHINKALHNYTGKTQFYRCGINTTMNSIEPQNRENGFEIDCTTLADLCADNYLTEVDLCKIDIEGSEFQAITKETIAPVSTIIKKFLIELHPRTRESQNHFKTIFESCKYKTEYFDFNGSLIAYK
jgi:FkbM family methyltransferase